MRRAHSPGFWQLWSLSATYYSNVFCCSRLLSFSVLLCLSRCTHSSLSPCFGWLA